LLCQVRNVFSCCSLLLLFFSFSFLTHTTLITAALPELICVPTASHIVQVAVFYLFIDSANHNP
jgi:hypothetical protein